MIAPAVVSTLDGWATLRSYAEDWLSSPQSALNCVFTAEVQSWAVLSWGTRGIGDSDDLDADRHEPYEEVVVLGGRGEVRVEVDGCHPALLPRHERP